MVFQKGHKPFYSWHGKTMTKKHRYKISISLIGNKRALGSHWNHTKETKKKMSESQKGNMNNWRGGVYTNNAGYIMIFNKNHPFRNNTNYIQQHRLIIESHINRYLKPNEYIHHINGIRNDNRLENLKIVSLSEHNTLHHKGLYMKRNKLGQFVKINKKII